jgi:hypothetical protein
MTGHGLWKTPLKTPPLVLGSLLALLGSAASITPRERTAPQIAEDAASEMSHLGTPLVLDLGTEGGLAFSDVRQSTVFFDLDGDGRPERVAWLTADTARTAAFLAWDRNGNGRVDGGRELFGNQHGAAHGFAELARLDANVDGVVDSRDEGFAALLLWRDDNANGVSEPTELRSVAQSGVMALPLAYTAGTTRDTHGNGLFQVGRYVRLEGGTGSMVDVWLRMDKREDRGALL